MLGPTLDSSPPATTDQDTRLGVLVAPHRRQLDARSGHDLDFKWFHRRLANSESERIGVGPTGHPEPPIIPVALVHIGGPSPAPLGSADATAFAVPGALYSLRIRGRVEALVPVPER